MNNKGFSLIELLVVMSIASVILAGSLSLMEFQIKQSNFIEAKNNLSTLVSSVSQTVQNETSCSEAITRVAQNITSNIQLTMSNGVLIGPETTLNDYNLLVNSLQLKDVSKIITDYLGNTYYYGTLYLSATATKPVVGTREFRPRIVAPLYVTVNGSRIVACGTNRPNIPEAPKPEPPKVEPRKHLRWRYLACNILHGNWNEGRCSK